VNSARIPGVPANTVVAWELVGTSSSRTVPDRQFRELVLTVAVYNLEQAIKG